MKGQISVFLIVTAILVLVLIITFYSADILKPRSQTEAGDVKTFVETSLETATKHCLIKIGIQGGRYSNQLFLEERYSNVEYAYLEKDVFLSTDELQAELEQCIQDMTQVCINDFEAFKGLEIKHGDIDPQAVLAAENVPVRLEFDVSVEKGEDRQQFTQFANEVPVRLKALHEKTEKIIKKTALEEAHIDLFYLGFTNVNSSIYEEEDKQQLYVLADPSSMINNENYLFLFANKFENEEQLS